MPSYSPVFSQGFIYYNSATPNNAFDVPDGFTAVIRQISGVQEIGAYTFSVLISSTDEGPYTTIFLQESVGAFEYVAQEGRWVVPGGGSILGEFSSYGSYPAIYVGGYLLRNTLS